MRARNSRLMRVVFTLALVAPPLVPADAQSGTDNTTSPMMGEPFTPASLTAALKGMKMFKARMGQSITMNKQLVANQNKRSALIDSSASATNEYNAAREKVYMCAQGYSASGSGSVAGVANTTGANMQAIMADPVKRAEFMKAATAVQTATAKGDTAGTRIATATYMKMIGMPAPMDSAAAEKKCGGAPPKPAILVKADSMGKANDAFSSRIRQVEISAGTDGAKAAGVNQTRFDQMRERLSMFAQGNTTAFSAKELALLNGKKSQIQELLTGP